MQEDPLTLDGEAQKRAMVLTKLLAGDWTSHQAAVALGVSQRQLRRLKKDYRQDGAVGVVHGNRGRRPANALTEEVRTKVIALARDTYAGFNHQHLTEKLVEDEGLALSRSTVRRILAGAGLATPRPRRAPKHRSRRERLPQEGMLLQADGSRHQWLGQDGPWLTLVGGIDDATGEVPYALFREQEDAHGYMLWLQAVVLGKGVPLALYVDRHGIFIKTTKRSQRTLEEQLSGQQGSTTQFGRVLQELGITPIYALSPQGKGRVERLWGTFQDRLTSELRLAGATTIAEANAVLTRYLPAFNARFGVPAAQPGSAYRPLPVGFAPEQVFCFKYRRTVAADNTVQFGEHRLQLLGNRERASYARAKVEVQERLDGSLAAYYQGRQVAHQPAPVEAPVLRARHNGRPSASGPASDTLVPQLSAPRAPAATVGPQDSKKTGPDYDHPWRTGRLTSKRQPPSPPLPAEVEQAMGVLSEEFHEPRASRKASLSRVANLLTSSTIAPTTFLAVLSQARETTLRAQAAGRIVGRQADGRPRLMAYLFAVLENDLAQSVESAPLLQPKAPALLTPAGRRSSSPAATPTPQLLNLPAAILKYTQRPTEEER